MNEDDRRLQALVAAVTDGFPVDWGQAESTARSDHERAVVRQLRVLATVATVHRSGEQTEPMDSRGAGWIESSALLERWGPLELRELVGSGGYGVVYRAWDSRLDREVALKLLSDRRAGDETFRESVVSEGRLLARVRHPNVIAVYGADTHEERVGFWMEFLEGQTLKQWVDEHGPMSSREATLVGIDVARALAAVHGAGLVHRDVKAQNVMREAGGRTVLMDFGAGVESGFSTGLAGTPLYMAPEVLAGRPATPVSDIYGVGVLLYYLVSGRFPLSGPSLEAIREAHATADRGTLRDVRPDLPAAFVRVVERALASDPGARPATSGLLEAELAASLEFPMDGQTPSPTARRWAARGWRGWLMTGLGATALIALLWAGGVWTRVVHYVSPGSGVRSLAVLPLENLGGHDQDYLAAGMTDLLTTNLSKLKALKVIARTSVDGYRRTQPLREFASALGVDAVVRGSVLRDGNRLRVTAQLIATRDGTSLWAETYERDVRDMFTLEADLARDIARGVNLTLTPQEQQRLASSGPANLDAQDEYLKGYAAIEPLSPDGAAEAIAHFENAIRLDPNYAQAYASAAYTYMLLAEGFGEGSKDEAYAKAHAAALKALELDDTLSAAHYVLGLMQFTHEWDWLGAQASFERALELDPNDADAHQAYGTYLAARGMLPEALAHMNRARLLDPLLNSRRSPVAEVLYYMKRYDDAIAELRSAIDADRHSEAALSFLLGRVYASKGMTTEALELMQWSTAPQDFRARAEVARVLAQAGRTDEARALLDRLEAEADRDTVSNNWDSLGFVYATLGQSDRAFDLLSRAAADRLPAVLFIKVDPRFDPLRSDPRFGGLVTSIGIP